MVDEKIDKLFTDFLLQEFEEELKEYDIKTIIEDYSSWNRISKYPELFGLLRPYLSSSRSTLLIYLYYFFLYKLDVDIFDDDDALRALSTATSGIFIHFSCPVPEDLDITLDYDKLIQAGIKSIHFRDNGYNGSKHRVTIKNVSSGEMTNKLAISLPDSNDSSCLEILLPDNLTAIRDEVFHPWYSSNTISGTVLLFKPKDGKTGFTVPYFEAEKYKKILKPIH